MKRLDAEILRDAILAISGGMDRAVGGAPVMYKTDASGMSRTDSTRRSLYLLARRIYPLKFMEIFDAPIIAVNCPQRTTSATVLQSLAQLNSKFLFEKAERSADRVARAVGEDSAARIRFAFQLVFAREPQESELEQSLLFLKEQTAIHVTAEIAGDQARRMALADLCHMMMSTNEFLYVE